MHSTLPILFAGVLFFVAVPQSTIAINCYHCSRGTDGCDTNSFKKTGSGIFITTDSSPTYCTKTIISSNLNAAARSYASSGTCNSSSTATVAGVTVTTLCCSTDLCNNGYIPTANFIIAMSTAAFSFFLVK